MENIDINRTWDDVLLLLKDEIPEPTYSLWVCPLVPNGFSSNEFSVLTSQNLSIPIINKHHDSIVKALSQTLGQEVAFRIIFSEELNKKLQKQAKKTKDEDFIKNLENRLVPSKYDGLKQMQSSSNLNLKYKFENFVVGQTNNFAYHAALAVAQKPGAKYNPLFIYGGSGLGKTHLLQAIGHEVIFNTKLKVKYIKTEEFINDFLDSLAKGGGGKKSDSNAKMAKFRDKYRNVDVLLIDDIQLIEGKKGTQEEIFNTFDVLHNAGKQIVITSDRPPESFSDTPDRLKSRFAWGLITDVQVPDIETRMAILIKMSNDANIPVPRDVIEFLAQVYSKNIRELEGAFNTVCAYSEINNIPITLENTKKIINYSENSKMITLTDILEKVCKYYRISKDELLSTSRSSNLVKARQVIVYFAKEMTQDSLNTIGDFLKRKHSTIIHSLEEIKKDMQLNPSLVKEIADIAKIIKD
ncbi:chromosomal replication initiator protein DnaA [bacterium]|nr:chromosomal replication initiator protein DnaA [bacterium]